MRLQDIDTWLTQVESTAYDASPTATASADPAPTDRHQRCQQAPSPPESHRKRPAMDGNGSSEPDPKRQKVHADPNTTPKASSSRYGPVQLGTAASPSPSFPAPAPAPSLTPSDAPSSASGRSSPSKQLASLELGTDGVEQRKLSLADLSLPPALSEILLELQSCSSSGVGIMSASVQAEIEERAKTDARFRVFMPHMFAAPVDRDRLGPIPPVHEVDRLVEMAARCQVSRQNESGWNMMVHYPLLYSAIYGPRKPNGLVGFQPCTTAKIIREYLPSTSPAKMVDFCVYLDPTADDEVACGAIRNLCRSLPCEVINHTEFQPFRRQPIAISVETKSRNRAQSERAELQLGTWHSAQWRFLERLVERSGGSFDGLPFLPAVVVQGHDWSFAATTREGRRTVLWLEHPMGSTSDIVSVYKTVWCLQRMVQWASEVYWPWFRENCLTLGQG